MSYGQDCGFFDNCLIDFQTFMEKQNGHKWSWKTVTTWGRGYVAKQFQQ